MDPPDPEEEDSGLLGVPQAPQVQAGKGPSPSQTKPTQPSEASKQDASDELSKESSSSRLVPESLFTLDSSDDEVYTDSLTSHTTASDSTTTNLISSLDHLYLWNLKQLVKQKVSLVPACPILKIVHL